MSKMTPRSRAASTSSRTTPSGETGVLGNGRKQCVRMSPLRSRDITSERYGGGASRCVISGRPAYRSEEHTSELQSQSNLVCRLLLEKKKHRPSRNPDARLIAEQVRKGQ